MAKASRTETPLQFRGKPGSLSAAVSDDVAVARRVPVRVALASKSKDAEKLVVRASRIEGDMVLQMTLPPRTPPGQYEGEVDVEGGTRAVVIVVEPEIELQIVPDQLTLQVTPGEKAPVEVSIANAGNVAVEIRGAYALGIFAAGGLERALHRAYTDKRPDDERRIDYLGERLADEHGGVVRVAVEKGEGTIEPGEVRSVTLNFHVPSGVQPGRTYTGTMPLHDLRYYVRLNVVEGKEPEPPRVK
jgi:hypothetical protein